MIQQLEVYTKRKWVSWMSQTPKDAGFFLCPEDHESVKTKTTFFSYGTNVYTSSSISSGYDIAYASVAFFARKNIRYPSKIIYAGDVFHKNATPVVLDQNAVPFLGIQSLDQNRQATGVSFRHLLGANFLYVAGHVTPHKYSFLNNTKNDFFTKNK